MGDNQYNIKKDCPKCECQMTRMLSHPTFICYNCKYEEKDTVDRGDLL